VKLFGFEQQQADRLGARDEFGVGRVRLFTATVIFWKSSLRCFALSSLMSRGLLGGDRLRHALTLELFDLLLEPIPAAADV
jgi:hypothetical protein